MKLRFPPKIFPWDDYLPPLLEMEAELERVRIKTPLMDAEFKIRLIETVKEMEKNDKNERR